MDDERELPFTDEQGAVLDAWIVRRIRELEDRVEKLEKPQQ